ncbi:MAG: hypothetical protein WB679_08605 [Terracidiphilus sp.]
MLKRLAIVISFTMLGLAPIIGQSTQPSTDGATQSLHKGPAEKQQSGPKARQDEQQQPTSIAIRSLPQVSVARDYKGFWGVVYDWGPWVFAFLLVVVGAFQIVLLIVHATHLKGLASAATVNATAITRQAELMEKQLREIRSQREQTDALIVQATEQAKASKIAAEAAEKSAQALMDGERAWLLAESIEMNSDAGVDPLPIIFSNAGTGPVSIQEAWLSTKERRSES